MATPLTDKINALTSAANETTGASDTTLGDAVATLIAGYGSGGGGVRDVSVTADSTTSYNTVRSFASAYITPNTTTTYYLCIVIFENNSTNARAGISAIYGNTPAGQLGRSNRVGGTNLDISYGMDVTEGATVNMRFILEDDSFWSDYFTA